MSAAEAEPRFYVASQVGASILVDRVTGERIEVGTAPGHRARMQAEADRLNLEDAMGFLR